VEGGGHPEQGVGGGRGGQGQDEDHDGGHGVDEQVEQAAVGEPAVDEVPADRLGELGEDLERLSGQDQREDLDLLADRPRDRFGQAEDQADDLGQRQEVEGDADGHEVRGRDVPRQGPGQPTRPPGLDRHERAELEAIRKRNF